VPLTDGWNTLALLLLLLLQKQMLLK